MPSVTENLESDENARRLGRVRGRSDVGQSGAQVATWRLACGPGAPCMDA